MPLILAGMGTLKAPPIFRFMRWLEHRKTLCGWCREQKPLDGQGFCSDYCALSAADQLPMDMG
jgi:hypothetical protein